MVAQRRCEVTPLPHGEPLPSGGIVIALCARTANAVQPWADAGYECWCVDVQHSIRRERVEGNIHYVWGDVRTWKPPRRPIAFLFCTPPCTHLAVSGARDFKTKGVRMLCDALELFNACEQAGAWSGAPYLIENPVGVLSSHIRKPDYTFQPWQYGDNESKQTCLWTGNGFVMPRPEVNQKPADVRQACWLMPPSADRADLRAVTPPGFARAVFEANSRKPAEALCA
jgi:hypothetical protein